MSTVDLENDRLHIRVATQFGGRVVQLLDKASGRDWIAKGGETADVSETAVYGREACVGWDECFPTVSPWDATATAWRRQLRDHGDIWGRPTTIVAQAPDMLTTRYLGEEFSFTRALSLQGSALVADYAVENRGAETLPYLWAMHALYAAQPGERLVLPGIDEVLATYLSHGGNGAMPQVVTWPSAGPEIGFPLDVVQPESAGFAGKLYATGLAASWTAVGRDGAWLKISWDPAAIAHSGLWLNYGGWPDVPGLHHVALEATTASADHLGDAIARDEAVMLAPGETRRWQVVHSLVETLDEGNLK